jgi:SpoIID/LytB domain protein
MGLSPVRFGVSPRRLPDGLVMSRGRTHRSARIGPVAVLALAGACATFGSTPAAALVVTPAGSVTVTMLGIGHGHGMSQYGARGAAMAGLTAPQIVAFYYPGTTLTQRPDSRIRVQLSAVGPRLTVAPAADLIVTGRTDPLPTAGVSRYRLVAGTGDGLWLQRLPSAPGAAWTLVQAQLPSGASFHRSSGEPVRALPPDGSRRDYLGSLVAWRTTPSGSGDGVLTVNKVSMDDYTAGVVPEEVPTSWPRAAVNAQAIAARTYGAYAVDHPRSRHYDICDTSWCQVYGGHAQFDAAGHLVWSAYPRAALATTNQVLEHQGAAIFAEFGSSDGGWTVDGGQPYLVSKQDPYDNAASGDPYLFYRKRFAVSSLAAYFGLRSVTSVVISKRDGNGTWNGRVLAGYVQGTNSAGNPAKVTATGSDFAAALGLGTTWFNLRATA